MSTLTKDLTSLKPQNAIIQAGLWQRVKRTKEKIEKRMDMSAIDQGEFIAELCILSSKLSVIDDLLADLEAHVDSYPHNPCGVQND